jgi:hypothetical protein
MERERGRGKKVVVGRGRAPRLSLSRLSPYSSVALCAHTTHRPTHPHPLYLNMPAFDPPTTSSGSAHGVDEVCEAF